MIIYKKISLNFSNIYLDIGFTTERGLAENAKIGNLCNLLQCRNLPRSNTNGYMCIYILKAYGLGYSIISFLNVIINELSYTKDHLFFHDRYFCSNKIGAKMELISIVLCEILWRINCSTRCTTFQFSSFQRNIAESQKI